MPVTRVPSLLEQSIKSNVAGTNPEVRRQLGVASTADMNLAVANMSTGVNAISGSQAWLITQFNTFSAALSGSTWTAINNVETDQYNLDLSTTVAISGMQATISTQFNTTSTTAISGSYILPSNPQGFITIHVNGSLKKIPYYG